MEIEVDACVPGSQSQEGRFHVGSAARMGTRAPQRCLHFCCSCVCWSFAGVRMYLFQSKQTIPSPHTCPPQLAMFLLGPQVDGSAFEVRPQVGGRHLQKTSFNHITSESSSASLLYQTGSSKSTLIPGTLALPAHLPHERGPWSFTRPNVTRLALRKGNPGRTGRPTLRMGLWRGARCL